MTTRTAMDAERLEEGGGEDVDESISSSTASFSMFDQWLNSNNSNNSSNGATAAPVNNNCEKEETKETTKSSSSTPLLPVETTLDTTLSISPDKNKGDDTSAGQAMRVPIVATATSIMTTTTTEKEETERDNNNNNDTAEKNGQHDHCDENHDNDKRDSTNIKHKHHRKHRFLHFLSILFFILGSTLYLVAAILDYQWAQELLTLPLYLRVADDDLLWMEYRLNERNGGVVNDGSGSEGELTGGRGIRRRLSRMRFRRVRKEKQEKKYEARRLEEAKKLMAKRADKRGLRSSRAVVVEKEGKGSDSKKVYSEENEKEALAKIQQEADFMSSSVTVVKQNSGQGETATMAVESVDIMTGASIRAPESVNLEVQSNSSVHDKEQVENKARESKISRARAAKAAKRKDQINNLESLSNNNELPQLSSEKFQHRLLQTPEELYYDLCWTDLPDDIREAYEILGYDEDIWEGEGIAFTEFIDWPDLTEEQREAALLIGYSEEDWCMTLAPTQSLSPTRVPTSKPVTESPTGEPTRRPVTESPTKRPTNKPVTASPTKQPTPKPVTASPTTQQPIIISTITIQYWKDLTPGYQNVYETLGYTQSTWDAGTKLPMDEKLWNELSSEERFAVVSIGYDSSSWDAVEAGKHFANQPLAAVEVQYWKDLTSGYQDVYIGLGYTETSWNNGDKVGVDYKTWADMNFAERLGVYSLGFTQELWDGTAGGEHFKSQPLPGMASQVGDGGDIVDNVDSIFSTPGPTSEPTQSPVQVTSSPTTATPSKSPTFPPTTASPTKKPTPSPSTSAPTTASPIPVVQSTTTTTSTTVAVPKPPISDPTTDEAEFNPSIYYDEWWKDLPPHVQEGYTKLGYNEQMWNGGLEPDTNTMDWVQLTTEQREAALSIGYTEDIWCETAQPSAAPTKKPTIILGEAPPNATFAGFFSTPTNGTNANATTEEGVADNTETSETPPAEEPGYYETYDWVELPPDVQEAAAILGYDEQLWDTDGLAWSEDYWWRELPPEAQEAAALLGYDEESWDSEEPHEDAYVSEDDDYIFQVSGMEDVWVSRYQVVVFFAALSFVFVGVLDLLREKVFFHMLMILAGLFGVASAIYVEEDIHLSNVFNSISVHLFLLEGITLFYDHNRVEISAKASKWMKRSVMLADLEFAVGAFVDVVLSYFWLLDDTADWDIPLAIAGIVAAVLWLHCPLIYMGAFFYCTDAESYEQKSRWALW